jgi:hypothetical protein
VRLLRGPPKTLCGYGWYPIEATRRHCPIPSIGEVALIGRLILYHRWKALREDYWSVHPFAETSGAFPFGSKAELVLRHLLQKQNRATSLPALLHGRRRSGPLRNRSRGVNRACDDAHLALPLRQVEEPELEGQITRVGCYASNYSGFHSDV